MRKLLQTLVASALATGTLGVGGAGAAVVFSQNFNTYAYAENWAPPGSSGFYVSAGSVDLIGHTITTSPFDFYKGNGGYVDLDGSTHKAGALTTLESFAAGNYTLTFDLGGNDRGDVAKTTSVYIGGVLLKTYTLASNAGFNLETISFHTTGGRLTFADGSQGNTNIGNILDNVTLSSTGVPEPVTWGLMLVGVAGIGASLRRLRAGAMAAAA
jgi:hypothetical protein